MARRSNFSRRFFNYCRILMQLSSAIFVYMIKLSLKVLGPCSGWLSTYKVTMTTTLAVDQQSWQGNRTSRAGSLIFVGFQSNFSSILSFYKISYSQSIGTVLWLVVNLSEVSMRVKPEDSATWRSTYSHAPCTHGGVGSSFRMRQ